MTWRNRILLILPILAFLVSQYSIRDRIRAGNDIQKHCERALKRSDAIALSDNGMIDESLKLLQSNLKMDINNIQLMSVQHFSPVRVMVEGYFPILIFILTICLLLHKKPIQGDRHNAEAIEVSESEEAHSIKS
jgi:hypothetical protein